MAPRRLKMNARWIQEASRGPRAGPKWNQKGAKCMPHGDPNKIYGIDKSVKNPSRFHLKIDQEGPNGVHAVSLEG